MGGADDDPFAAPAKPAAGGGPKPQAPPTGGAEAGDEGAAKAKDDSDLLGDPFGMGADPKAAKGKPAPAGGAKPPADAKDDAKKDPFGDDPQS
jgi:hypothetical protein